MDLNWFYIPFCSIFYIWTALGKSWLLEYNMKYIRIIVELSSQLNQQHCAAEFVLSTRSHAEHRKPLGSLKTAQGGLLAELIWGAVF